MLEEVLLDGFGLGDFVMQAVEDALSHFVLEANQSLVEGQLLLLHLLVELLNELLELGNLQLLLGHIDGRIDGLHFQVFDGVLEVLDDLLLFDDDPDGTLLHLLELLFEFFDFL